MPFEFFGQYLGYTMLKKGIDTGGREAIHTGRCNFRGKFKDLTIKVLSVIRECYLALFTSERNIKS